MPTITHELTPAQKDMFEELKKGADIAQALFHNAVAMVVAGVAPLGSKLTDYKDGVMTIEIPETKLSKDSQVSAVDPAPTQ